jgi:hypothetical protein
MLEVTGGSMAIAAACNNSVDWPAVYAASSLAAENAAQAEVLLAQGLRCGMQLHMTSMYAQPPIIQVRLVGSRAIGDIYVAVGLAPLLCYGFACRKGRVSVVMQHV